MFDFHEKRKIRGVFYSRPVVVFLLLITALLSFSAYNRYTVARDMENKLDMKRAELNILKERAAAIDAKVRHLEDERGLEEELRNRFDAVREGEQAIIFLDTAESEVVESMPEIAPEDTKEKQSFFERFIPW